MTPPSDEHKPNIWEFLRSLVSPNPGGTPQKPPIPADNTSEPVKIVTSRVLLVTALADQANCDHGNQSSRKIKVASRMVCQVGSAKSRPTICEKAKTNARSKKSSTGSAVKSSSMSGTTSPRMPRP